MQHMRHMMQVPRLRRHVDGWPGHVGLRGGGNVHLGRVQRDHVCSVEYYLATLYQVLLSSAAPTQWSVPSAQTKPCCPTNSSGIFWKQASVRAWSAGHSRYLGKHSGVIVLFRYV